MTEDKPTTMEGALLLVGSVPCETAEEVFRSCAHAFGGYVDCLPDGEIGDRKLWTPFLALNTYSKHPEIEETHRPSGGELVQPEGEAKWIEQSLEDQTWTFRIRDGVDAFEFGDLGYADAALDSYRTFERLRSAGEIPSRVRFQACFPGSGSAIQEYFTDPAQWDVAEPAYRAAVHREIDRMLAEIPADDLVVQFDLAWEVVDLSMGDTAYEWTPDESFEQKWVRQTLQLDDWGRNIPDNVLMGYHLCYGTWGGWPMTGMTDLTLCVDLSNEIIKRAPRRIDYVHMPVIKHPDDAFFAPLRNLQIGRTKVFLGMIHHTDGLAGAKARMKAAAPHLESFGLASVCGYGRVGPKDLDVILKTHRESAEALAVGFVAPNGDGA